MEQEMNEKVAFLKFTSVLLCIGTSTSNWLRILGAEVQGLLEASEENRLAGLLTSWDPFG